MKYSITFILTLFVISTINGQKLSKKELNYKPKNLSDAVFQLKRMQQDSTKQRILVLTENEFLKKAHFGLGMWIRNNWGLWKNNELVKYFKSNGIYHPDDMSGIILISYYRELHGIDWKVDEQIKYYQDYLKKSKESIQKTKVDSTYQNLNRDNQDRTPKKWKP